MADDTGPDPRGRGAFDLRYVLEAEDFEYLMTAHTAVISAAVPSSRRRLRIAVATVIGVVIGIGVAYLENRGALTWREVAAFVLGGLLLAAGFLTYYFGFSLPAHARKLIELNRLVGEPLHLEADARSLKASSVDTRIDYQWSAVERIDESPERILIWVSGLMAVIVPARAFADDAARAGFVEAVKRRADVES